MYRVELDSNRWMVLDLREQAVFAGTKQQVEDWLDSQDNRRRASQTAVSSLSLYRSYRCCVTRFGY